MLEFLVDNIFVVFAGKVLKQTFGISMSTDRAHLLVDIFLYSYEADFIQCLLAINNPKFDNNLYQMYLEIKDTTESTTSAFYLDLLHSIGRDSKLYTSIYDKRDYFKFYITNFLFLSRNIPFWTVYGVFISQLIRNARVFTLDICFILRARQLPITFSNRDSSWNA